MSYNDIDYDDEAEEEESETTLQSAREELEYWTEFFQEQKDEKPEEWMFYRNPFLDPSVYAFWILTDEEKELLLHWKNWQGDIITYLFSIAVIRKEDIKI